MLTMRHVIAVLVRLSILCGLVQVYGQDLAEAICVTFLIAWAIGYFECVFDKAA